MRYSLCVALILMPAVASSQFGARVEDDGVPRVVASATKTVRVTPDRVTIYAIAEGAAETAAEAAQRAERKLQAMNEAVRQLGGKAEVLSTVPYGVMASVNFNGYPGQTSANPYTARYVLRVQPSRVDQLMGLSSALIAAGATVGPPSFEAAASDSVRRARFAEALAQARGDAEALASGLGMRLGALIEVTANQTPSQGFAQSFISFNRGFDAGPAALPEVVITSSVTVRYRLQPR